MAWPELPVPFTRDDLVPLFKQVNFLQLVRKRTWRGEADYIKFVYDNASRIVLVSGMQKDALVDILADFNAKARGDCYVHAPPARISKENGFWISIETTSPIIACHLKKVLRSTKRNLDQLHSKTYKIEKRRIRIVVL